MTGIRIMHVISGLAVGGAERNLLNLIRDQSHPNITHIVVCRRLAGGLYQDFVDSGVELIKLKWSCYALYNPLRWLEISEIAKLARRKKIDILHGHCPPSLLFVPLAARKAKCRSVISVHAMQNQLSFFEYQQIFPVRRWVDRYIEGSRGVYDDLVRSGIPEMKLEYIPYGVDGAVFAGNKQEMRRVFRENHHLSSESFVACRIARFHPQKGFDLLLRMVPDIIAVLPMFKLILVGDGSEMQNLKQLVSELGIDKHVIFTGFYLNTQEVYAASDLVLITARAEALGISTLETLASAKAVVSFDVGGLGEVLENDVNAMMIKPGDSSAFIKAVIKIASDHKKRAEFEKQSLQRFEKYSLKSMREGLAKIYQELC